jgi:sRNA-binding regulator protein Hfq
MTTPENTQKAAPKQQTNGTRNIPPVQHRPKDAPIIFYLTNGEQVKCRAEQWQQYQYEHIIAEENSDIIIPKGAVVKIRAGKK